MYSIIKLEPQIHIKTLQILRKKYVFFFNISFNAILIYLLYFNTNQVQIFYFPKPIFPALNNVWSFYLLLFKSYFFFHLIYACKCTSDDLFYSTFKNMYQHLKICNQ